MRHVLGVLFIENIGVFILCKVVFRKFLGSHFVRVILVLLLVLFFQIVHHLLFGLPLLLFLLQVFSLLSASSKLNFLELFEDILVVEQTVCKLFLERVFLEETLDALFNDGRFQYLMNTRAKVWVLTEHQFEETCDSRAVRSLDWSWLRFDDSAQ